MTDDIVTRLRKHHEWFGNGGQPTSIWEDAADEIERLRADLEKMRQVAISEHRRWCDRPCDAEQWSLHD